MDLKAMDDSELDGLRVAVLQEQERRENLAEIPEQIAVMAKLYRDGGGDEERLQEVLTPEQLAASAEPAAADHFDYLAD